MQHGVEEKIIKLKNFNKKVFFFQYSLYQKLFLKKCIMRIKNKIVKYITA